MMKMIKMVKMVRMVTNCVWLLVSALSLCVRDLSSSGNLCLWKAASGLLAYLLACWLVGWLLRAFARVCVYYASKWVAVLCLVVKPTSAAC